MIMKNKFLLIASIACLLAVLLPQIEAKNHAGRRPSSKEIAITFDDLPGVQLAGAGCDFRVLETLNRKLIATLVSQKIPALGLVVESRLCDNKKGSMAGLLEMWLDAGLELGNHSFSHFDLNNTTLAKYQADVIRGESVTRKLLEERGRKIRFFRHPYLHAGKDLDTKRAFEKFLVERGYQIAPVTIDNQEWVFAEVYARALRSGDSATMKRVGTAYIDYMEQVFDFFERLSIEVVGYEIKQVLLLHDNPLNADYFDKLVQMMRTRGYTFITLEQALKDPAYRLPDNYAGTEGLSWLHRWAITKGLKRKVEPREPPWLSRLLTASQ